MSAPSDTATAFLTASAKQPASGNASVSHWSRGSRGTWGTLVDTMMVGDVKYALYETDPIVAHTKARRFLSFCDGKVNGKDGFLELVEVHPDVKHSQVVLATIPFPECHKDLLKFRNELGGVIRFTPIGKRCGLRDFDVNVFANDKLTHFCVWEHPVIRSLAERFVRQLIETRFPRVTIIAELMAQVMSHVDSFYVQWVMEPCARTGKAEETYFAGFHKDLTCAVDEKHHTVVHLIRDRGYTLARYPEDKVLARALSDWCFVKHAIEVSAPTVEDVPGAVALASMPRLPPPAAPRDVSRKDLNTFFMAISYAVQHNTPIAHVPQRFKLAGREMLMDSTMECLNKMLAKAAEHFGTGTICVDKHCTIFHNGVVWHAPAAAPAAPAASAAPAAP